MREIEADCDCTTCVFCAGLGCDACCGSGVSFLCDDCRPFIARCEACLARSERELEHTIAHFHYLPTPYEMWCKKLLTGFLWFSLGATIFFAMVWGLLAL
jgi:hypothetical protein